MEEKGIVRSPIAVILLTVITCGIYGLYWIYAFANELKTYLNKDDLSPGLDLFLCIICFPYLIYWVYKYGQLIDEAFEKNGKHKPDNSILYVILSIFGLSIVAFVIMQDSINRIWSITEPKALPEE